MKQEIQKETQCRRILYLDVLRIVSTFAVMILHLAATGYKTAPEGSAAWVICWLYNFFSRFAVPVFVMISGALFLNPNRTTTPIKKNILRLLFVFASWSVVYALTQSAMETTLFSVQYWLSVLRKTLTGHYHMWYLYMIMGLYLAVPFLRLIAADRRLLRSFILISFLLTSVPRLLYLIPVAGEVVREVTGMADIGVFAGYVGYFCLGAYLQELQISKKQLVILCISAAVLMAAMTIIGIRTGTTQQLLSEKMPHVAVYGAAVFLTFKEREAWFEKFPAFQSCVAKLASCSLGMYLVHPAINFILKKAGLHALTFSPVLCVPLCGILVFGISFAAILVMKKLPVLKRLA